MSPNYPNDYPSNLRCNYTFIETTNRTIGLNFTDFKIEDSK
jgi:CUB domain.